MTNQIISLMVCSWTGWYIRIFLPISNKKQHIPSENFVP